MMAAGDVNAAPALAAADKPAAVPFGEAFRFWLQLGFISFGGPAGQIAIMHRELVEKKRWFRIQCGIATKFRHPAGDACEHRRRALGLLDRSRVR